MSTIEELRAKALERQGSSEGDGNYEDSINWKPQEDKGLPNPLMGWIEERRMGYQKDEWEKAADIYAIREEKTGNLYKVLTFHSVLESEMRKIEADVDDYVFIEYTGKPPGKRYHHYLVAKDDEKCGKNPVGGGAPTPF